MDIEDKAEDESAGYYVADKDGNCRRMPPPGLSASQRLRWANEHCAPQRATNSKLSEEELGMTYAAAAKLSPRQRLALANSALARREKH